MFSLLCLKFYILFPWPRFSSCLAPPQGVDYELSHRHPESQPRAIFPHSVHSPATTPSIPVATKSVIMDAC